MKLRLLPIGLLIHGSVLEPAEAGQFDMWSELAYASRSGIGDLERGLLFAISARRVIGAIWRRAKWPESSACTVSGISIAARKCFARIGFRLSRTGLHKRANRR